MGQFFLKKSNFSVAKNPYLVFKSHFFFLLALLLILCSCSEKKKQAQATIDYYNLPTYSKDHILQAVIEIPAGTNEKIEYRPKTNQFQTDSIEGKAQIIDFLPYPGNYGFIPSTFSEAKKRGDGDPLAVLIIGETAPTKTLQKIIPIALLKLKNSEQIDTKIIAVPYQKNQRIIKANTFQDLAIHYPAVRRIIGSWFKNYDKKKPIRILGWLGEEAAKDEIERRRKK